MTETMRRDLLEIGESPREIERMFARGVGEVAVSTTPNGREIRVTPAGFIVQPADDNYWITVGSIDEAMDAFENPAKYRG